VFHVPSEDGQADSSCSTVFPLLLLPSTQSGKALSMAILHKAVLEGDSMSI
jgi:hypothetical protein